MDASIHERMLVTSSHERLHKLSGEAICVLHPYHFAIDEANAKEIMEVYDCEWTDEEV